MANPTFDDMYDAIYDEDCAKIDAIVQSGLGIDSKSEQDEWNYLHMALVSVTIPPSPEVIRHLIDLGVGVNDRDARLWTPLHFAVRTRHTGIVKMLLEAGAEADPVTDEGITPLHLCFMESSRNLEIAKLLLEAGADPDKDHGGGTVRKFVNSVSCDQSREMKELVASYRR